MQFISCWQWLTGRVGWEFQGYTQAQWEGILWAVSATTLGAAKWTMAFAILGLAPAGGRNSILWPFTSSGSQFPTCLHVEWAFLPSTTQELLLQYLVTFSSQGQKSPTLLHVDLSLITFCLRTCFLPRKFIHVFIHSFNKHLLTRLLYAIYLF